MDNDVNYTLVGAFVIGLALLMAGFLAWMLKFGFDEQQLDTYLIRMNEAVSGLNVESPVKYLGVSVGVVEKINIATDDPRIVEVHIAVEKDTPIMADSKAKLASQGITGLSYIEIVGGSKTATRLKSGSQISAGKSLLRKLESSATDISDKIIETLSNIDKLLSQNNLAALSNSLRNIEITTATLNQQFALLLSEKNINALEATLDGSAKISQLLAQNGDALIQTTLTFEQQATITMTEYTAVARELNATMGSIQVRIDRGEFDIRAMTEPHLEAFNALLKRLEVLSIQAGELLQQLEESPSDLLFKQNKTKAGPGES